jgi:hypothetical protein
MAGATKGIAPIRVASDELARERRALLLANACSPALNLQIHDEQPPRPDALRRHGSDRISSALSLKHDSTSCVSREPPA